MDNLKVLFNNQCLIEQRTENMILPEQGNVHFAVERIIPHLISEIGEFMQENQEWKEPAYSYSNKEYYMDAEKSIQELVDIFLMSISLVLAYGAPYDLFVEECNIKLAELQIRHNIILTPLNGEE